MQFSPSKALKTAFFALFIVALFASVAGARTISVASVDKISITGLTSEIAPSVVEGKTTYDLGGALLVKLETDFGGDNDFAPSFYASKIIVNGELSDKLSSSSNVLKPGKDVSFEVPDSTSAVVKSTQTGVYQLYVPLHEIDCAKIGKATRSDNQFTFDFGNNLVPLQLWKTSYEEPSAPLRTVYVTKIVVKDLSNMLYPTKFSSFVNRDEQAKYLCLYANEGGAPETRKGIESNYDTSGKYAALEVSYAVVSESNTKQAAGAAIASIRTLLFEKPLKTEVLGDELNSYQQIGYQLDNSKPEVETQALVKLEKATLADKNIYGYVRFLQSTSLLNKQGFTPASYADAVKNGAGDFNGARVQELAQQYINEYYSLLPNFEGESYDFGAYKAKGASKGVVSIYTHSKSDTKEVFWIQLNLDKANAYNAVYTLTARTESADGSTKKEFQPEDASKLKFAVTTGSGVGQYRILHYATPLKFKDREFTFTPGIGSVAFRASNGEETFTVPTKYSSDSEMHVKVTNDGRYALVFSKDSAGSLVVTITDLNEKTAAPKAPRAPRTADATCEVSNTLSGFDIKDPSTYADNQIAFKVKFNSPPEGKIYVSMGIMGTRFWRPSSTLSERSMPEGVKAGEEVVFEEFRGFVVQPALKNRYVFQYSADPSVTTPNEVVCTSSAKGADYGPARKSDSDDKAKNIKKLEPGTCEAVYTLTQNMGRSMSLQFAAPEGDFASYTVYFASYSVYLSKNEPGTLQACYNSESCRNASFAALLDTFHPNIDAKTFATHFEWKDLNAYNGFQFDDYKSMVLGFTNPATDEQIAVVCPISKRFNSNIGMAGWIGFESQRLSGEGNIGTVVVTADGEELGQADINADGRWRFLSENLYKFVGKTVTLRLKAQFNLPDGRTVAGTKMVVGFGITNEDRTRGYIEVRGVTFQESDVVGAAAAEQKTAQVKLHGSAYYGQVSAANVVSSGTITVSGGTQPVSSSNFNGLTLQVKPDEIGTTKTVVFLLTNARTSDGRTVAKVEAYKDILIANDSDTGPIEFSVAAAEKPAPADDRLAGDYFQTNFLGSAYYKTPDQKIASGSFSIIADNNEVYSGQLSGGSFSVTANAFKNTERTGTKHFVLKVNGWLSDEQTYVQGSADLGFKAPTEVMDFGAIAFDDNNAAATKEEKKSGNVGVQFSGTAYALQAVAGNQLSSGSIWLEGDEDHKASLGPNGEFTIQTEVTREDYKKSFELTLYVDSQKAMLSFKQKITLEARPILAFNDLGAVVFAPKAAPIPAGLKARGEECGANDECASKACGQRESDNKLVCVEPGTRKAGQECIAGAGECAVNQGKCMNGVCKLGREGDACEDDDYCDKLNGYTCKEKVCSKTSPVTQTPAAPQPEFVEVFVTGSPAVDGKPIQTGNIFFLDPSGARLGEGALGVVTLNFFSFKLLVPKEYLGKNMCFTVLVEGTLEDNSYIRNARRRDVCAKVDEFGINFGELDFQKSSGEFYASQAKAPKKQEPTPTKAEDALSVKFNGRAYWHNSGTPLPGAMIFVAADPSAYTYADSNANFELPVKFDKLLAGTKIELTFKARFKDSEGKQREESITSSGMLSSTGGAVGLGGLVFNPQPDLVPIVPVQPEQKYKTIYVVFVPFYNTFEPQNNFYKGVAGVNIGGLSAECDIEPRDNPRCLTTFKVPADAKSAGLAVHIAGQTLASSASRAASLDYGSIDLSNVNDGGTVDLGQVILLSATPAEEAAAPTPAPISTVQPAQAEQEQTKTITFKFQPFAGKLAGGLAYSAQFYSGNALVEIAEFCNEKSCITSQGASDTVKLPPSGTPVSITLTVPADTTALKGITLSVAGWLSKASADRNDAPLQTELRFGNAYGSGRGNAVLDFGRVELNQVPQ